MDCLWFWRPVEVSTKSNKSPSTLFSRLDVVKEESLNFEDYCGGEGRIGYVTHVLFVFEFRNCHKAESHSWVQITKLFASCRVKKVMNIKESYPMQLLNSIKWRACHSQPNVRLIVPLSDHPTGRMNFLNSTRVLRSFHMSTWLHMSSTSLWNYGANFNWISDDIFAGLVRRIMNYCYAISVCSH